MSREEKIKFDADVEAKIKEIDSTMALEGMPLTASLKNNLRKCFNGSTTPQREIAKLKEKYKRIYGQI